jgi:hypothetical protein
VCILGRCGCVLCTGCVPTWSVGSHVGVLPMTWAFSEVGPVHVVVWDGTLHTPQDAVGTAQCLMRLCLATVGTRLTLYIPSRPYGVASQSTRRGSRRCVRRSDVPSRTRWRLRNVELTRCCLFKPRRTVHGPWCTTGTPPTARTQSSGLGRAAPVRCHWPVWTSA